MRGLPSRYMVDDDDVVPDGEVRVVIEASDGHEDERLRLSDIGKLARRGRARIVDAARAHDRPTFASLIAEHLGVPLDGAEVVEERWPSYDLVNVQLGFSADQLDTALEELLDTRNAMTRVLLGGGRDRP